MQTTIKTFSKRQADLFRTHRKAAGNTRLAQWGLTSFIETLCFYCKFVLVDNLVFKIPPLYQAWERYQQFHERLHTQWQSQT